MDKRLSAVLAVLLAVGFATEPAFAQIGDCGRMTENDGGYVDRSVFSEDFESTVGEFVRESAVLPGAAIGIVMDGRLVLARGYGFRDLSTCAPVNPDTGFYLKSTTKSFSGMVAAILHEEGLINLDAPITDYLPDLSLPAPINPDQVSLADHFTHTQPYRAGALNYRTAYAGNLDEKDFVEHIKRFGVPRDIAFRYSNEGPIIGMHAIGRHLNTTWQDLIQERVFGPAGMAGSFTSMTGAARGPLAKSYYLTTGRAFEPTRTKTDRQMHAAGGAVSTVNDLTRWVLLNLNGGRLGDEQVIPKRAVEHAHARIVHLDVRFQEFDRFAHGLGLYSADYDGDLLMHHFGGETHVSFMPERRIGVVVLSNAISGGAVATHGLAATVYDLLLGKQDVNRRAAQRLDDIADRIRDSEAERAERLAELEAYSSHGQATLATPEIAGMYTDPRLGSIRVAELEDGLTGEFGEIRIAIRHLGGDYYSADFGIWGNPPTVFRIARNARGQVVLDWGGRLFVRHAG